MIGSILKNKIINGDSLVELKKIPDETFDLIFADPPYNIPLKNKLTIVMSDMNKTVYDKIISGQTIQYSATGMMTVESAWSIVELDFDTRS